MLSPEFKRELKSLIAETLKDELTVIFSAQRQKESFVPDGFITKKQSCEFLKISLSNLNNKLKEGIVKKHRFGSKVLIKKCDLERLVTG